MEPVCDSWTDGPSTMKIVAHCHFGFHMVSIECSRPS